ncbi:MAG: hypothetical protein RI955_1779 [Bacteroidota bacterium]|jgi:hypothetical protein
MQATEKIIQPLLTKVEAYGKTSCELLKLQALDKSANMASTAISRLLFAGIFLLFIILLNVAIALLLGDVLGKNYYGFFIVAAGNAFIALCLFFFHPLIKSKANNFIIFKALN